jgi:4-amino-4-deoxy-L-arabinose transferase-like glycosyltransferase
MNLKKHLTIYIFFTLILLIFAFSWKDNVLFTDEILFEEAAYQMNKTGDFLTPHQEESVWLEKPPLYFWLTAIIYQFALPTPFTRRLITLFAALATVILTYKLALHLYSKKTAQLAMIILTTTPLFLYFSKTANLDIPATFFITATLLSYLKSKKKPKWLLVSGLSLGLGILTRSFLALTPILVIALDQVHKESRKIPARYFVLALTLTLALTLPWHLHNFKKFPQTFTEQYLGFNITSHFLKQTPGHQPLSATKFLFNVLVAYNPLALLASGNLLKIPKSQKPKNYFLLIWIVTSLLPISLSATRHEWYAIQALPPIAILSSQGLVNLHQYLKPRLKPRTWELLKIFSLSILFTLPAVVFLNMPKEAKSVVTLRQFLIQTPEGTQLYNLNHKYTPNTTLFNPRQTFVIQLNQLQQLKIPFYIYVDSPSQSDLVKSKIENLYVHQVIAEDKGAQILHIKPK